MSEASNRPYSVPEAATRLGLNPKTLYEAVKAREVPSIRVGRRVLIPRAAFDRLVAEGANAQAQ